LRVSRSERGEPAELLLAIILQIKIAFGLGWFPISGALTGAYAENTGLYPLMRCSR
jgi:hypothetical protein